jgi:hypothetical protein
MFATGRIKETSTKTYRFDGFVSPELCPVAISADGDDNLSDILPKRVNLVSSTKSMFLGICSVFNLGVLIKKLLILLTQ